MSRDPNAAPDNAGRDNAGRVSEAPENAGRVREAPDNAGRVGEALAEPYRDREPAATEPRIGNTERLMRGSTPKRRLIVWRHGETTHNAAGIWQGQLDTELSERGREQVAAAAELLSAYQPVALWSSDLRRASSTADALAQAAGLEVRLDERFREIHVGEWQGMTAGDVAERHPELQEQIARGDDPARGVTGETVAQVVERTRAAVADVLAGVGPGETAVITTHGVTGRALAADLVGIDQRTAWLSLGGLHNAHWVDIIEHRFGWRIDKWNGGAL